MKQTRLFFAIAAGLLMPFQFSYAQYNWSAGYQLCFGNSNEVNNSLTPLPYKKSLPITNQVFVNRQISQRFYIEAAVGYSTFKSKHYTFPLQRPPIATDDYVYQRNNIWNLTLSAKYRVLHKKQITLLIPLGFNNLLYSEQQKYTSAGSTSAWQTTTKSTALIGQNIFTGIEANFNISSRFYVNLHTNIGLFINDSEDLIAASNGRSSLLFGYRAGIGYRF